MRYQDLVIKNGKFVGEFERMYQEFDDPWHQSEDTYYSSLSRRAVCYFLEKHNIKSIVEWGCGLGKTSSYIKNNTKQDLDMLGIDISKSAIDKASEIYPNINFQVDDISNISKYKEFDCMFFSEITWYLLENKTLDNIFDIMKNEFKSGGGENKFFIHNLVFYKKGFQKYGAEYFSSLNEFIEYCPFELLGKIQIDNEDSDTIETSVIFKL
jgi:SAM-dependent methyltransferase